MKNPKYLLILLLFAAFGFLLYSKAITLIYVICTIVAVLALVGFVLIYYLKYIDEQNEPKKITVEGLYYSLANEEYMFAEYERNLFKVKLYFENRYVISPVKIVYFFQEVGPEFGNIFFISAEEDKTYEDIKHQIKYLLKDEKNIEFIRGLPTV